jgi:hypothetical protein
MMNKPIEFPRSLPPINPPYGDIGRWSPKSRVLAVVVPLAMGLGPLAGSAAGASSITNPASSYPHTIDGIFTDWTTPAPASFEWYDIQSLQGLYSNVYVDYDGSTLFIMNDWYVNKIGSDPANYNYFKFWEGSLTFPANVWELFVYGDGHTDLKKNGIDDPSAKGAYHFGPSPLMASDHTMWEVSIDVGPGNIFMDPFDPIGGGPPLTDPPVQDPRFPMFGIDAKPGGGTTTSVIPELASSCSLLLFLASGLFIRRRGT